MKNQHGYLARVQQHNVIAYKLSIHISASRSIMLRLRDYEIGMCAMCISVRFIFFRTNYIKSLLLRQLFFYVNSVFFLSLSLSFIAQSLISFLRKLCFRSIVDFCFCVFSFNHFIRIIVDFHSSFNEYTTQQFQCAASSEQINKIEQPSLQCDS